MRVSSLSDDRVIDLLSRYFIPVWVSRDHYQKGEPAKEERDELLRIDRERARRKLPGGTVCVFMVAPDGSVTATMPVQQAYKAANLVPLLERTVADRKLEPRDPKAVKATKAPPRESVRPETADGLVLHVWARGDVRGENRGVSEAWVELTAKEWRSLTPEGDKPINVPRSTTDKLYRLFYPPGPIWDATAAEVLQGTLTVVLESSTGGVRHYRLSGATKLCYPANQKPADGRVTAEMVGYLDYDEKTKTITRFGLVSEEAVHVWYWKGEPQRRPMRIAVEQER
jgi:hypothetical protein